MVGTTDLGRCYADRRAAEVVARANTAYHSVTAPDMRTAKAPAANARAIPIFGTIETLMGCLRIFFSLITELGVIWC